MILYEDVNNLNFDLYNYIILRVIWIFVYFNLYLFVHACIQIRETMICLNVDVKFVLYEHSVSYV